MEELGRKYGREDQGDRLGGRQNMQCVGVSGTGWETQAIGVMAGDGRACSGQGRRALIEEGVVDGVQWAGHSRRGWG